MFGSNYAHRLMEDLFTINIPDELTRSNLHLERVGVFRTGDVAFDKKYAHRRTTVKACISTILEYFENGIDIRFPKPEVIPMIREIITGYLDEWKVEIEHGLNVRVTPYANLLKGLEELNESLYDLMTDEEIYEEDHSHQDTNGITMPIPDFLREEPDVKKERKSYSDRYGNMSNMINTKLDRESGR